MATYPTTVAAISNNNNSQDLFAYAHGRTVVIYSSEKNKQAKEISTFSNNLSAICIRADGAVFAAAD